MKITGLDALCANFLAVFIIVVVGFLADHFFVVNTWLKVGMVFFAFLFFILSERIWMWGKKILKS
jgi:hypothetical protein